MVFDPSVYETASVATETYNPIISDEEWDSDMESDFDMLHQVHMLELMGYDVWLTRENLQEELESVFASRRATTTRSSAQWRLQHPHFSFRVVSEMMALFALYGAENILRSAPRRNNLLWKAYHLQIKKSKNQKTK